MITTVKSKSMLIVKNMFALRYFAARTKFHVRTTYSARYSVKTKPQDNSDIGQARDWESYIAKLNSCWKAHTMEQVMKGTTTHLDTHK